MYVCMRGRVRVRVRVLVRARVRVGVCWMGLTNGCLNAVNDEKHVCANLTMRVTVANEHGQQPLHIHVAQEDDCGTWSRPLNQSCFAHVAK